MGEGAGIFQVMNGPRGGIPFRKQRNVARHFIALTKLNSIRFDAIYCRKNDTNRTGMLRFIQFAIEICKMSSNLIEMIAKMT